MLIAKGPTVEVGPEEEVLISGGGDGTIKLWCLGNPGRSDSNDPQRSGLREIMSLGTDDAESVLSLALDGSFLYAGKLDGIVELWDLDTAQRLRVIRAQNYDIMSLQMGWGYLWTTSADGWASVSSFPCYISNLLREKPPLTVCCAEIQHGPLWKIPARLKECCPKVPVSQ